MRPPLRSAIERRLRGTVVEAREISGGDINVAHSVKLSDGREIFVKSNDHVGADFFAREAEGLFWLAESNALRTPGVLAVSSEGQPPYLVLEHLRPEAPGPKFDEDLGRGLARLHRFGAPSFGLDTPNYVGSLPQDNRPEPDWATFYGQKRLLPQLRRAKEHGRIGPSLAARVEALVSRLDRLLGPDAPPARLHGDLWRGNISPDDAGRPCLIDPAVYGGHREVDLAMMRLFGGFGERVFGSYAESYPLSAGHEERLPIYQLYPLLVHVNLFGGSYVGAVERVVRRYE